MCKVSYYKKCVNTIIAIIIGAFADCGPIKVLWESDAAAFVTIEDKRQMYIDQVQHVQRLAKEAHDVDLIVKVKYLTPTTSERSTAHNGF